MRSEALVASIIGAYIVCVAIFVAIVLIVSGLGILTRPYVLVPIIGALSSGGAYLGMLGAKKDSRVLRSAGAMLMATSAALFVLLIARLMGVVG